jgi:hypothetical protein
MEESGAAPSAIEKAKNGRPSPYSEEIGARIIEAVRGGLTLERAAEYVGLNPSTVQGWTERRAEFGRLIKKARREHELSLLRSVEAAGEKSWQARAWCLERIFQYAQPSARLQVTQDHTHNLGGNLAQLLAGIRGRKQITSYNKTAELENRSKYIDVQPIAQDDKIDKSHTKILHQIPQVVDAQHLQNKTLLKVKHKPMRRRKPRAESLAKYPPTTTPPLPPPAAV